MNVILIGLRGSGKTEVGRRLAARLGRKFVDLDDRVLATFEEASVREVWATHGESAWRVAEGRVVGEILAATNQVIALGGGTPMVPDARDRIESGRRDGSARVFYLSCDVRELARRLAGDAGDRPSLTGADPSQEVDAVLVRRDGTFRALADHVLDVTGTTPDEIAESLLKSLEA